MHDPARVSLADGIADLERDGERAAGIERAASDMPSRNSMTM
jgi:hypothetical protein